MKFNCYQWTTIALEWLWVSQQAAGTQRAIGPWWLGIDNCCWSGNNELVWDAVANNAEWAGAWTWIPNSLDPGTAASTLVFLPKGIVALCRPQQHQPGVSVSPLRTYDQPDTKAACPAHWIWPHLSTDSQGATVWKLWHQSKKWQKLCWRQSSVVDTSAVQGATCCYSDGFLFSLIQGISIVVLAATAARSRCTTICTTDHSI